MRNKVIAGNWKMHKEVGESVQFVKELIAKEKLGDMNTTNLESAKHTVAGSARSMGVQVIE